jgi:hypothetical protein
MRCEHGSLAVDRGPFHMFMHERLDATFAAYLSALEESLPQAPAAIQDHEY